MEYKELIQILGFTPKENTSGIFQKKYSKCGGYSIEIDFEKEQFNFGDKIKAESKTTQNFSQPENWVVIECVDRLLEKGYQPQNITLEKTWKTGHGTSGRLDILVSRDNGSAYLMIECKTWGAEFDKEFKNLERNGGQLFTYFQQDKDAEILMLYASQLQGNNIEFKNIIVKIADHYRQAGNVNDFYERWNKQTVNHGVWENPPYDFQLLKFTKDRLVELNEEAGKSLFHGFASILRKHSVSDKPNAFNVIFNLFLAKLYDEQKRATDELEFHWRENDDPVDFQVRLYNLHKAGLYDFLKKEIEGIEDSDFNRTTPDELKKAKKKFLKFNKLFDIKSVLDDTDFEQNHRVLKEVVQLIEKYQIRYPKKQRYLSDFFELLLTTGLKQEVGQYFTPPPITKFIVKSLPIQEMMVAQLNRPTPSLPAVIDYAAGSGHFITEIMEEFQEIINNKIDTSDFYPKAKEVMNAWKANPYSWASKYIYGIEKDYRLVKVAKVGCYFYGDGLAQVIHADGLDSFSTSKSYVGLLKENTNLEDSSKAKFSIVVSNPPYSVDGCKDDLEYINSQNDFSLYSSLTDKSSEIECLFVERTKQLLKDGGVAGIILPSSILSNTGIYSQTREIILKNFEVLAIAEMGSNTFMATGTNTVTLFLRRRNNADAIHIEEAIKKCVVNLQDVTINGIEKPISKYIAHVWEGITYDDYKTLLQKTPNDNIQQHEIYQEYQKKIKAKNDKERWDAILTLEQDKLLYFIIAYPQKLVLVKTGSKKEEKRFLGYEFSNRRGNEGMHPIQRSKTIDECTQLYDPNSLTNPEKASTYIYKAFNGEFDLDLPENLQQNISYQNLVDMFTFDRMGFEKRISLSAKKKVKIESKWEQIKLENITKLIKRGKSPKYGKSNVQIIKSGQARGFYKFDFTEKHYVSEDFILDERKLQKGDLLLNSSGIGTAGRVTAFFLEGDFVVDSHISILRFNIEKALPKYVLNIFGFIGFKTLESLALGQSGQIEMTIDTISNFKIPLPPKNIQEKIVTEIEALEQQEQKAIIDISKLKDEIKTQYLSSKPKYTNVTLSDEIDIIGGGTPKTSVSEYWDGNIPWLSINDFKGDKRYVSHAEKKITKLGLEKSSTKMLNKGDLIISARGTVGELAQLSVPMTFNQSCYGIRSKNNITNDYLYYALKFEIEQFKNNAYGAIFDTITTRTFSAIKIPLPPLPEQQKIVSQIEKIEQKITVLEKQIQSIPQQKEAILKKYLA